MWGGGGMLRIIDNGIFYIFFVLHILYKFYKHCIAISDLNKNILKLLNGYRRI